MEPFYGARNVSNFKGMVSVVWGTMTEKQQGKQKTALEKKALAGRARRLAQTQSADADRLRLVQFADELDKEVEALEQLLVPPAPVVRQVQQQVQQQQSREPVAVVSSGTSKD